MSLLSKQKNHDNIESDTFEENTEGGRWHEFEENTEGEWLKSIFFYH